MKLSEVKRYLQERRLDAIVIFNKSHGFNYFLPKDFEHGVMFLTKKGNYLFLSPLYAPKFRRFKVVQWTKFKQDFEAFIKKHKIRVVGTDNHNLLLRQKKFISKYFRSKDVSKFLHDLRASKTKEEVAKLRKACRIVDSIFYKIVSDFKFKTEVEIKQFIKIKTLEAGAEISFEPIVANGRNAVIAHHDSDSKLRKGFLLLDFGVKYEGYLSDMTRTIYLGSPTKQEKEIYEKVRFIQQKCIEKVKIGMKASKPFEYAVELFGKDSKYFIHALGHGIGVQIHEAPNLGPGSKENLVKGSVFTIEPGYYNKKTGIGIRIEDDIYLGDKKEILTKSTKKLICVKNVKNK